MSAIEIAVERAISVLRRAPSALVTDIDGTISAIVARPQDARVEGPARDALRRLSKHLALVGIVTAREESVARSMVGVESLTYVGNYALESGNSATTPDGRMEQLKVAVRPLLTQMPCVTLEEKGISFSLHYRNCSEDGVRERLLDQLENLAGTAGARLVEGKQVIEVVPANLPDKGQALARLLDANGIEGVVFVGDDLSDTAAFREVKRRSGLAVAVVDQETPITVREAGDLELGGVEAVTAFLSRLANCLEKGDRDVPVG
ncbi:MAG TPA: trehalose-phosphatase [Dehalococcoidia bacterium]|nr:trehalose-phosphatase [Dehalococcoidia bacterium]